MSWMTLPEKINYNTEKHGDLPAISQKNYKGDMGFSHVASFASKSYFNGGLQEEGHIGIYLNPLSYKIITYLITVLISYILAREYFLYGIDLKLVLLSVAFLIFVLLDTVYIK